MTPAPRRTAAAAAGITALAAVAALAAPARADGTPVPVSLASGASSRTLELTAADGSTLDSAHGLELGPGKTATVTAKVTDAQYSQTNYQVSSTMTNLYKTVGTTPNFTATDVPSSAVGLSSPLGALDLAGISAKVQPVFTLTGNLAAFLTTLPLGSVPAGLLPAGLPPVSPTTITSFSTTADGTFQNVSTYANHVLSATLDKLPLPISGPQTGHYANAAPLSVADTAVTGTPTSLLLLSGTTVNAQLAALLTNLQSTVNSTLGAAPGSLAAAIAAGYLDQNDVVAAVNAATGIPVNVLAANAAGLVSALTAQVTGLLNSVLGQSGLYSGTGKLDVTIPTNLPAGTYKGVLTVTLADTPAITP